MALTKVIGSGIGTVTNQFADANMSAGSVVQVIQGGRTSRVTHNSTTFTDIGVSAAITPSSTSSNILITLTGVISNANASNATVLKLFRGTTEIGSGTGGTNASVNNFVFFLQEGGGGFATSGFAQQFLDEDVSTTSAVTYKIQMAAQNGTGSLGSRAENTSNAVPTRLILTEVAG